MKTYSFQNLGVWQESKTIVVFIYELTKTYPKDEMYGLSSQMRRAAISVCSNIAEGAGRQTKKNQAQFYTIAYGSLMELLNQLLISVDLKYLSQEQLNNKFLPLINNVSLMLYKLKQY